MASAGRPMQSVFRAANERLREVVETASDRARMIVICECSDGECFGIVELPGDAEREVGQAGHFIVLPGHADLEIEHVVAHRDGYDVVHKDDEADV